MPVDIYRIDVPVPAELRHHEGVVLPYAHLPVDQKERRFVVFDLAVVYDPSAGDPELLFDGAGLLYSQDSEDIMPLVKKKLGI